MTVTLVLGRRKEFTICAQPDIECTLHSLDADALDKDWARELTNGSNYQQASPGRNSEAWPGPGEMEGGVHRASVTV